MDDGCDDIFEFISLLVIPIPRPFTGREEDWGILGQGQACPSLQKLRRYNPSNIKRHPKMMRRYLHSKPSLAVEKSAIDRWLQDRILQIILPTFGEGFAAFSSEENTDSTDVEDDPVPLLGLRLSYFKRFFEQERANILDKTTFEVCRDIIKPKTEADQLSFCEKLLLEEKKKQGPTLSPVDVANVFISHAWRYKFKNVAEAILEHFEGEEDEIVVWFDIFSNNQHKLHERDYRWWTETFTKAVDLIHHTVVVLEPWDNPEPFQRAWCIWELYSSISTNTIVDVCMGKEQRVQFLKDMKADA